MAQLAFSKEVGHRKFVKIILYSPLYKLFKILKNVHELEITGLEFIINSQKYKDQKILCSISKDGYLRLWDLDKSPFWPVYEVCGISKRWMYDVVWDPSVQSSNGEQQLQYNIEGRFLSYNMLYFDNNQE